MKHGRLIDLVKKFKESAQVNKEKKYPFMLFLWEEFETLRKYLCGKEVTLEDGVFIIDSKELVNLFNTVIKSKERNIIDNMWISNKLWRIYPIEKLVKNFENAIRRDSEKIEEVWGYLSSVLISAVDVNFNQSILEEILSSPDENVIKFLPTYLDSIKNVDLLRRTLEKFDKYISKENGELLKERIQKIIEEPDFTYQDNTDNAKQIKLEDDVDDFISYKNHEKDLSDQMLSPSDLLAKRQNSIFRDNCKNKNPEDEDPEIKDPLHKKFKKI